MYILQSKRFPPVLARAEIGVAAEELLSHLDVPQRVRLLTVPVPVLRRRLDVAPHVLLPVGPGVVAEGGVVELHRHPRLPVVLVGVRIRPVQHVARVVRRNRPQKGAELVRVVERRHLARRPHRRAFCDRGGREDPAALPPRRRSRPVGDDERVASDDGTQGGVLRAHGGLVGAPHDHKFLVGGDGPVDDARAAEGFDDLRPVALVAPLVLVVVVVLRRRRAGALLRPSRIGGGAFVGPYILVTRSGRCYLLLTDGGGGRQGPEDQTDVQEQCCSPDHLNGKMRWRRGE
mmetsp:Transcript_21214/g.42484  ORF Transcript_21214/g.42484 Transcript_21214/m.42484 type:complete len:289 (-) Transcript_21214:96-962(-)